MIMFFLSPVFFVAARLNYIDIFSLKMIKTEKNFLRGNRDTIKKALKLIKRTDPASYKTVIKYVDRISERPCVVADWHLYREEYLNGLNLPGCYTLGSKTIYLKPGAGESEYIVKARAQEIIKLADFSRTFWQDKK